MNLNKRIFFTCLAITGLVQAASLGLSSQPLLVLAAPLPILGMLLARRSNFAWLAHLSLTGVTALSAAGLLAEAPVLPIVLASTAALAAWDLLLESHLAASDREAYPGLSHEKMHLKSLGLAVGAGLVAACAGAWIHWQAPFLVSLALVVLALYCLDRALHYTVG